ncbi:WRKY transcription factor [Quillaja saponaria]|uniref:WRKY transcription factor n=1 Tax=Quillaja saponaria TaxID=32244 RepID=A0AAD7L0U3_QUISA|nr:WRKY transcription factor [Quillaja saponaria]
MVMDSRFHTNYSEESEPTPETGPDSPSSGYDSKTEAPSPKKRRVQKRVVSIPIGDVDGSRSKGETYPPSDSWAWRKYGQKPIKGSPYPRGYYRCSSSKGCPARKQVERSRVDPTLLVVTYACDHNHSSPAKKSKSTTTTTTNSAIVSAGGTDTSTTESSRISPDELAVFACHHSLPESHWWLDDVASTSFLESPICAEVDDVALTMREEDDSLFADLGELPEFSTIFRGVFNVRSSGIPCCGSTG